MDWVDDLLSAVAEIAPKLPTGLQDPKALQKLVAETNELEADIETGDRIGALTELADVAYYAAKAMHNNLIDREVAMTHVQNAAKRTHVWPHETVLFVRAKYELRARGVKMQLSARQYTEPG